MRNILLALPLLSLCGCEPKGRFPLSEEEVMKHEDNLPGEIFLTAGVRTGPYKEGPGAVGNENTAGTFQANPNSGLKGPISWPAAPGYFFETHSYVNQMDESFYVVRKVPVKTE